jgi:hypothetical protein
MADKRTADIERLKNVRDAILDQVVPARASSDVAPPARALLEVKALATEAAPPEAAPPSAPDGASVNNSWNIRLTAEPSGLFHRIMRRLLSPLIEAQTTFNSHQVQLDNQVLDYLDKRFDATHGHYDAVLGIHGRHMEDIDKRHLILQEELVAHVHDLVRRIDLILEDSERNRLSLEAALREARARLTSVEERLSSSR